MHILEYLFNTFNSTSLQAKLSQIITDSFRQMELSFLLSVAEMSNQKLHILNVKCN